MTQQSTLSPGYNLFIQITKNQEKILEKEILKTHKEKHDAIEKRYMRLKQGMLTQIKTLMTRIKNQEQIIQQHRTAIDQLSVLLQKAHDILRNQ